MAVGIIPYLVAMLVAIGVFRASGALDLLLDGVRSAVRRPRPGHPLRRRPAHRPHETPQRQRRARHDDRDHADPRRRLLRRPPGQRHPGQHRDHVLRAGRVLRGGGHQAQSATRWSAGWRPTSPASRRPSWWRTSSGVENGSWFRTATHQASPTILPSPPSKSHHGEIVGFGRLGILWLIHPPVTEAGQLLHS